MFREMRRTKQYLSEEECRAILKRATGGVLAVSGDDGYPYAVPLSYIYLDGKIYFHCGKTGHKMDAIRKNEKVSFCVVDQDEIIPEEFTSDFRSVILFGRAKELTDWEQKRGPLLALCEKYSPGIPAEMRAEGSKDGVVMVEIEIEQMTGKCALRAVGR